MTNHLEIVILEIPKAKRIYKKNKQNRLSQWMMFLDDPNNGEVSRIMKSNKEIREANEELGKMSKDERLRRIAELREKGRRDYEAAIDFAEEKGIDTGKKEKSMEIAKKMITEGLELDFIEKMTGLDKETIQKVKEEF